MGIKHKIQLGFLAIGALLLLSGIISSLELTRFNRTTYELLDRSRQNINLSKQMLDAAQEQNTALLLSITDSSSDALYDSLYATNGRDFEKAVAAAQMNARSSNRSMAEIQAIVDASRYYNSIVSQLSDSVSIEWFSQVYKTSYSSLTNAIKDFMVVTQHDILNFTVMLQQKAYRATMVAIISLGAGLMLMLLFYYIINVFFIKPILRIDRALGNHLNSHAPFEVKINSRDEILSLRQHISQLIDSIKKREVR